MISLTITIDLKTDPEPAQLLDLAVAITTAFPNAAKAVIKKAQRWDITNGVQLPMNEQPQEPTTTDETALATTHQQ